MIIFLKHFKSSNILSSFRITAIYSSALARKWVIICLLLSFGVLTLLFMSLGSEVGGTDGLSQVTTFFIECNAFFFNTVYCEENSLPVAIEFKDLHLSENLVAAAEQLTGMAGVYCFKHLVTGTLYIGSSMYLANRMKSHIFRSSNIHLRNAFKKHGLSKFSFIIIEFTELNEDTPKDEISKALQEQEQHWLDWLFSLPASMRYNFHPTVGSSLGYKHTEEAKSRISAALSGEKCYMFGKSHSEESKLKISITNGSPVYIYDSDTFELLSIEPSRCAAARFCKMDESTVRKYLISGKPYGAYLFRSSSIE